MQVHFESVTDKPTFLITEAVLASLRDSHGAALQGVQVTRGEGVADIAASLAQADALVAAAFVLSHPDFPLRELATVAPRLRWIHVTNAGVEKLLPLDWLPPQVTLTNSRGAHAPRVREYAAMSLLMLNTRLPRMITNQAHARWEKVHTTCIAGKTLCVVGAGHLGEAFGEEAQRLGLHVVGVRRSGEPRPGFDRMVTPDALHAALADADFVVACVPLTPATQHLFGDAEFAAMKPGASFVNVARGEVVDHGALGRALASGHLAGAMVDVLPQEPLPQDSPLWRLPSFVMTPHVALDDAGHFLARCLGIAMDNLVRLRAGRPLLNVVDRERGY